MLYFSPFFEATKLEGDKVVCQLNSATTWLCVIYKINCDWIWAEPSFGSTSSTIVVFANIVNIRPEFKQKKKKKSNWKIYLPSSLFTHTQILSLSQLLFCLSHFQFLKLSIVNVT